MKGAVFIFLLPGVLGFDFIGSAGWFGEKSYKPVSDQKAKEYLINFGYTESKKPNAKELESAIKSFQQFAGFRPTGQLSTETKLKMAEPRCGVADVLASKDPAFKWAKNPVTYAILNAPSELSVNDVKTAMKRAFDAWSKVIPLDFNEVSPKEKPDIKISFESSLHGKGGVFAFAKTRPKAEIFFDKDEKWAYMDPFKLANGDSDIFAIALHEIGHVLGLKHSPNDESIMSPFYRETIGPDGGYILPRLKVLDVFDVQDIYNSRKSIPSRPQSNIKVNPQASKPLPKTKHQPCKETKNKEIIDNNLAAKKGEPDQCCGFCQSTPGCKGYVWDDFQDGTCWLKSATGFAVDKKGVIMGTI